MTEAYMEKELEFMARRDALCEDVPVGLCDCGKCPARELCGWLEERYAQETGGDWHGA